MNYLAIDLGLTNRQSVAIVYDQEHNPSGRSLRFPTTREGLDRVVEKHAIDVVIIEMCTCARWVWKHLSDQGVTVYVVNTCSAAFREAKQRHKSDLKDAERLKVLQQTGNMQTVTMLSEYAHRLRSIIDQRNRHVGQVTSSKNAIRALCQTKGIALKGGWDVAIPEQVQELIDTVTPLISDDQYDRAWRRQLELELELLESISERIKRFDQIIKTLTRSDAQMKRLQTTPGIGLITAASIIASIDNPHRFQNKKQVSSYSGFTPRTHQSGSIDRAGKMDRQGWSTPRGYLMEAVTTGVHRTQDSWYRQHYEHAYTKCRRKLKAQVTVARKLYIRLWYMMKNELTWDQLQNGAQAHTST